MQVPRCFRARLVGQSAILLKGGEAELKMPHAKAKVPVEGIDGAEVVFVRKEPQAGPVKPKNKAADRK